MAQRHAHDTVERLPIGHADPKSPTFVPIPLREAYAAIDEATVDALKRKLYTEISEPMWRRIAGKDIVLNHRTNDADFDTALCWLRTDEAAHRVSRDNERRTSTERDQRIHTCKLCGRHDRTATTGNGVTVDKWCQPCLAEKARQEVAAHAAYLVDGKTVAELIAATCKQDTT